MNNSNTPAVHCFVINLATDVARRETISAQLDRLQIPHTIFPAVDGRLLSEEELGVRYDRARAIEESHDLTRGEIGCALSHHGVYCEMVRQGISHALVLEDDARLNDQVPGLLPRLAQMYPADVSQVVMLNYVEKYSRNRMIQLDDTHKLVSTYGGNKNAHGYFLTLGAARKLSENLFPIWLVADRWERFKEKKFIRLKALLPYCIGLTTLAQDSNLNTDRVARMELYPRGGLMYYLHRYLYKKFIYQLFVRPFLRVATQKETW